MARVIFWFRRDLRLSDHPALHAAQAAAGDGTIVPLFVVDPALWAGAPPRRRAWLARSLRALDQAMDGALVVRTGDPIKVLPDMCREVGGAEVHATGETTPYGRRRDQNTANALGSIPLVLTGSPYVVDPGTLTTGNQTRYQVFTPFFRSWLEHVRVVRQLPARSLRWAAEIRSDEIPAVEVAETAALFTAGEEAAQEGWSEFSARRLCDYHLTRDRPDLHATSGLSVHLKFGEIHPHTLLRSLSTHRCEGAVEFRRQLAWRDFFADVLWHRPEAVRGYLRPEFARMEFEPPEEPFDAWTEGRTGFPFVDAGMRQLARTGFMHNRVRMVTASFLVKDLHIEWTHGARYFMRMLLDADPASNQQNWQWVAGCGADAAPYFRIFNPVLQGKRFDPSGDYIRRWVPELRKLRDADVHQPWRLNSSVLHGYPSPIVDHGDEREEALRRYHSMRA